MSDPATASDTTTSSDAATTTTAIASTTTATTTATSTTTKKGKRSTRAKKPRQPKRTHFPPEPVTNTSEQILSQPKALKQSQLLQVLASSDDEAIQKLLTPQQLAAFSNANANSSTERLEQENKLLGVLLRHRGEDKIFLENVADRVRAFKLLANFYTGKAQEEGERKYTGLWGALMRGLKNR